MTSEERILEEIKEKIKKLWELIAELKVTEEERKAWEDSKLEFQARLDDYKLHKKRLEARYGKD